jgi:hypothetical protein
MDIPRSCNVDHQSFGVLKESFDEDFLVFVQELVANEEKYSGGYVFRDERFGTGLEFIEHVL